MSSRERIAVVPLAVLVVLAAAVTGYFGWRLYDAPVDEYGAERVGVLATDVVVRAGGGNPQVCATMREVAVPTDAEAAVRRCEEVAARAGSDGPGWLGVRDLRAAKVDVGRRSGTVTVSGTLLTRGPAFPLSVTWPLSRVDGNWVLSGHPDLEVEVG